MSAKKKIIGVTVGTPLSPAKINDELKPVKTVNGKTPDATGNVEITGGGADGFSPIVTVASITGGHRVTITDKDGKKVIDVMDGADGVGIKSVKRTSGNGSAGTTDTYTITYTDNTTSTFTVYNGKNGANGTNGTSVTITDISESTASGGSNVVTFSDGKTLTVKNGKDGTRGTQIFVTDGANSDWLFETNVVFTFEDIPQNRLEIGDLISCYTKLFEVIEIVGNGYYSSLLADTKGADGKDAYESAQEGGYEGAEAEFSELLANAIDKRKITLGLHTDGLMYIFIDGSPVGNGVALPSGGVIGDVIGTLDENNNIILNGDLSNGTYTLKYEMADGTYSEIGNLVIGNATVYHSVTNNLTNCTNTNSSTQAAQGEAYTATIAANSGYELSSVVVSMDGTDITSTAVNGAVINIAEVTGDIVITAVATEEVVEIINWIKNSENADGTQFVGTNGEDGYKTDTRFGTSDGGERTQSGVEATGFIPVVYTDTLYFKGVTITDNSNETTVWYDENHTRISGASTKTYFGTLNGEVKAFALSDISSEPFATVANRSKVAYMRLSAGTIDANSIITKNQPIE